MQTEPQLSAEMEERFDAKFGRCKIVNLISTPWSLMPDPKGNTVMADANILKHFLATALADERKKVLKEVIKIVKEQYYIDVTVAKLNQLKGLR